MVLVMHCPNTEEKEKELARRVATLHAKAVIDYINALPYTYEDKIDVIEQIKKNYHKKK